MPGKSQRKTIVILGGGFFGVAIAQGLAGIVDTTKHRLIMVTASPKFVHIPATIRTVTTSEGQLENRITIPYDYIMKEKGEVKVGEVVSFTAGEGSGTLTLKSGETVDYDILILAPGSKWNGAFDLPFSPEAFKSHVNSWRAKIEKSKDIVLVGGGAVGIEFAAEISEFHKDKNITLVHNGRSLLNDAYPEKLRSNFVNRVKALPGVTLILGDALRDFTPTEDGTVTLKSGKKLHADLVIPTVGSTPNTDFIRASLGDDVLTASKHVKVLPTLQLPSHPNIFAAGDVIDYKEQKQAAKAHAHAKVIVKNVGALLKGQSPQAQYKGTFELIVITLGQHAGVGYFGILWGIVLGNWFSRLVKSRDLMINMKKKELGVPASQI